LLLSRAKEILASAWFAAIFYGGDFSKETMNMPVFSVEVASLSGSLLREILL
jgi:hypothetical protein